MIPITRVPMGINSSIFSLLTSPVKIPNLGGFTPQLARSLDEAPLSGNFNDQIKTLFQAFFMNFLGDRSGFALQGLLGDEQNPVDAAEADTPSALSLKYGLEGSEVPQPLVESEAPSDAGASSKPSPSGHKELDQWDAQIEAAARSTGLPANYIKATVWAESRGRSDTATQNPDGKHRDVGVMQISDYTYGDVMKNQPNAPRGLRADNPADNIMMGAWELKDKSEKVDGDLFRTSKAYVGTGDAHEDEYAGWVKTYKEELDEGKKLSDF